MTDSEAPSSEPSAKAAKTAAKPEKPARAAAAPATPRTKKAKAVAVAATSAGPQKDIQVSRHPNLGLAPLDMTASFASAAAKIRAEAAAISAGALEAAVKTDPTIRSRHDDTALRQLVRDGELMTERLGLCLASGQDRWITEYAEWIGPIQRRRGMPLGDLAALCAGIREQLEPVLSPDEFAAAARSLDAAAAILNRNGRVGGDRHHRNALLKWMYKGV